MRLVCCYLAITLALGMPDSAFAQPATVPAIEESVPESAGILLGGWYGAAELTIVRPRVKPYPSDLHGGVSLGTTLSPEFALGYRFASGRGLHFDYRLLTASGSQEYAPQTHPTGLGPNDEILTSFRPYTGHATWTMNTFDLDYTFRDPFWELLPFVRSRWELGARVVTLSSEVREPRTFNDRFGWNPTQATEWFGDERLTSKYEGGGPHFDYKLALAVDSWGLEFFAISDVAVLFGTRTARYSPVDSQPMRNGRTVGPGWAMETQSTALVDARPISDYRFACTAWNWKGDVGAKLTRPWRGRLVSVAAGYRVDYWNFGGKSSGGGGFFGGSIKVPDLDFESQGAFLRFEMQF